MTLVLDRPVQTEVSYREQRITSDREEQYEQFQPLVRRLIRQYGGNPEMRRDLAGEIYFRFCRLLEAYDPARGVPLHPHMVRQLTANVYTYARHDWRHQNREISLHLGTGMPVGDVPDDPTPKWDNKVEQEIIPQGLPEAIARLPKRQRSVVIWRYYEGRSFEEIAKLLNVRLATARSLLRHGLANLRRRVVIAD